MHVLFLSETCACQQFINVASSPQELTAADSIANELSNVIRALIIGTCGVCEQYGRTTLVYTKNSSDSDDLTFPVTKTFYRQSEYSKFVPVIRVPGVAIITRKKQDLSSILTNVAGGSILDSWPVIVFTVVMAMLAGIIVWFLVSLAVC